MLLVLANRAEGSGSFCALGTIVTEILPASASMGRITFEDVPMGTGGMKLCFKATVVEGPYEGFLAPLDCVIKVIKPSEYRKGLRIEQVDIEMQREAGELVREFNLAGDLNKKAYMREAKLSRMNGEKLLRAANLKLFDGEAFIIESLIHGEFEKFNSNSGWSCGCHNLPDALSHWSWVHTGGQKLLCDLQGHRGRPGGPHWSGSTAYYLFTDPAIMSPTAGRYGCTMCAKRPVPFHGPRAARNHLAVETGRLDLGAWRQIPLLQPKF